MKILKLTAENYKRLKAVEIVPDPDGNLVVIAGANAQGKSSILDSIFAALGGAAAAKEVTRPIRDGEIRASVELDMGDLVVTRQWTAKNSTLTVTSADGKKHNSPQSVLDSLVGRLSFDPLAFAQQSPRDQRATLLSLVDLSFDPAKFDEERQAAYDDRTVNNREVKRLENLVLSLPAVSPGVPDEEVSAVALMDEMRECEYELNTLGNLRSDVSIIDDEIEKLKTRLGILQEQRAEKVEQGMALAAAETSNRERIKALGEQVRTLDATNAAVRKKKERAALALSLKEAVAVSDELTKQIERIDAEKAKALAGARMPVVGLSFDETGVLYNDVPFSQASGAERLRVSVAMAMAANPQIRVIRITDGSLLDKANMAVLEQAAREHDMQVWIEVVREGEGVGFVIEDGEVVA